MNEDYHKKLCGAYNKKRVWAISEKDTVFGKTIVSASCLLFSLSIYDITLIGVYYPH